MSKVILIHPGIYDSVNDIKIVQSFASDVIPINYTNSLTKEEIITAIPESITHLAFMYHYPGYPTLPFFPDKYPELTDKKLLTVFKSKYTYYSDCIIDIIKSVKKRNPYDTGIIIDILTCNLTCPKYKEEVEKIEAELGVNIRFSIDKTGNSSMDSNWLMESEMPQEVNVREIYFTEKIFEWNRILSSDIATNIKAGNYSSYIIWNSSINTYTVQQNFSWSSLGLADADSYIGLLSGETFDGNGKTIDISGYNEWNGLFSTGGTNTINSSVIKNLGISNGITSLAGGFIIRGGQPFFKVYNCYSTGIISQQGGGIAGGGAGLNGICEIAYCYSTGSISQEGGGIVGVDSGLFTGFCEITYCYSTGNIGQDGGGIAAFFSRNCNIENCYSTGNIGINGGGIIGAGAGYLSLCTIINSYSTGNIGSSGGGIAGRYAGESGSCTIENCVCNANGDTSIITGPSSGTIIITNSSANLSIVNNSIFVWSGTIWKIGQAVPTVLGYNLPILLAFQSLPWIYLSSDLLFYDTATDAAIFFSEIQPTIIISQIPPCCQPNIYNKNPQSINYTDSIVAIKQSGRIIDANVNEFYAGIASKTRTAYSQPVFKSYYDYIQFLQGRHR